MAETTRTEPCPRWIRAYKAGKPVIDSRRAQYVWLDKPFPLFAFPAEDVDLDAVEIATRTEEELVVPVFRQMDLWLEEDDPILGHPRDPHHRVDARRSSRQVLVRHAGEVIASSSRPVIVFETGLAPRYYLPRRDWRLERLEASEQTTICPYKGVATYFSARTGEAREADAVWCYEHPFPAHTLIAGLLCPYSEKLEVHVDGERV